VFHQVIIALPIFVLCIALVSNAISLYEALLVREGCLAIENIGQSEVEAIIAALSSSLAHGIALFYFHQQL
jgi:hypothetical protein